MSSAHRLRIPKWINLPFGYRIQVKQIPDSEFNEELGADNLACWVVEEKTIYLRSSRNLKQRRADLAHEVGHAFVDWQDNILGSKHSDVKT